MIKEKLPIHKQFLVISSPVEFSLIANNGTDKVLRPAGVWQLDCYKLLPEKFMKNYPVFNLELEYDETKIPDGFEMEYYFTNINLGDSLKGISGDLVELSEYQFESLKSMLMYSEDFPSYNFLSKVSFSNFKTEYGAGSLLLSFPGSTTKALYLGCVVVLKDGSRISSSAYPFYIGESENVVLGNLKFDYKFRNIILFGTGVDLKITLLSLTTYGTGVYPVGSLERYEDDKEFSFPLNTKIDESDFSSIEFFVLA